MKKKSCKTSPGETLRQEAEKQLTSLRLKPEDPLSDTDPARLIYELQVHQIELELLNDQLKEARDRAEALASERYMDLYEFAPTAYFTLAPDCIIVQMNLRCAGMLGSERRRLLNKNFRTFVSSESFEQFNSFHHKIFMETGKAECELMLRLSKEAAIFVHLEGSIDVNTGMCSAAMIDITSRHQAEVERNLTIEALKRSNSELEQFAYIASHDLQEPLRMISAYTGVLEKQLDGSLDAKTQEYMRFIVEGSKRMHSLIQSLLSYSRVNNQKKHPVTADLNHILTEVLKDLEVCIVNSDAEIKSDELPAVFADKVQMKQLFQNLIQNAIKFRSERKPVITITVRKTVHHYKFCIQDNGIGIDPAYAERIFIIFQRLNDKDLYPGTGIGLSICRKIVELHGGKIWVESQPGSGSAFYFLLPRKFPEQ